MSERTPRKILHLDLDAFYCSIEILSNPSLRGIPFVVGGRPEQRGVVASCSYAARKFGVHSAMPMGQALKACPRLIIVPTHFPAYTKASQQVMTMLNNLTPFVEQLSIDEAFLDVSSLRNPAEAIAVSLQRDINTQLGLPCSLGVATNKLVAKIANTIGKAKVRSDDPPNAIQVIEPGTEATFLAALPIRELWGVGPKTAEQLTQLGVNTIGDIASLSEADLVQRFGKHGQELFQRAQGLDNRPVEAADETKSISKETTFNVDVRDLKILTNTLQHLSDSVGRHTRQSGLLARTVKIKVRWSNFETVTRQTSLPSPTDLDDVIFGTAFALFEQVWTQRRLIRLIGVGVSGFEDKPQQLGLWVDPDLEKKKHLQTTLDKLKDKFGEGTIKRGNTLK